MRYLEDKLYELKSRLTTSPHCFLPMIITEVTISREIMLGHITLSPMVGIDIQRKLFSKLNDEADITSMNIDNGYICDTSDLKTLSLSLYHLEYGESGFKRVNHKFKDLGDVAVILLNPHIFVQALSWGVSSVFPHLRALEIATAQYKEVSYELEHWDLFARPIKESWKKEIFAMARMRTGINAIDEYVASEPVSFDIGDLSEIAICVPVNDLIKGKFPERLMQPDILALLQASKPKMSGIQGYAFSVAGNIQEIEPIEEWINQFKSILPDEEWKANTTIDRLVADGAAKPRLIFHSIYGDSIFIGINRIEVRFLFYEEEQKQLLMEFITLVEKIAKTKFCHMQIELTANLGTIKETKVQRMTSFQESKSYVVNNLDVFHRIEADYNLKTNIMGVTASQRAWHYTIQIKTPWNEHVPWYDSKQVMDFWSKAENYSKNIIQMLMRGNAYARYKKI